MAHFNDLICTWLSLSRCPYFQIGSQSQILGIRTSSTSFGVGGTGGYNSTHSSRIALWSQAGLCDLSRVICNDWYVSRTSVSFQHMILHVPFFLTQQPSKDVFWWLPHQPEALSHSDESTLFRHHEQVNFPRVKSLRFQSGLLLHQNWVCSDRYKNWYLPMGCYHNKNLNYMALAESSLGKQQNSW